MIHHLIYSMKYFSQCMVCIYTVIQLHVWGVGDISMNNSSALLSNVRDLESAVRGSAQYIPSIRRRWWGRITLALQ